MARVKRGRKEKELDEREKKTPRKIAQARRRKTRQKTSFFKEVRKWLGEPDYRVTAPESELPGPLGEYIIAETIYGKPKETVQKAIVDEKEAQLVGKRRQLLEKRAKARDRYNNQGRDSR